MTTLTFVPATREKAMARIGIQGPAGSGKTKTALRMAEELACGGLIGLVDTERESARKYAKVPGKPELGGHDFQHLPISDCTPENLIGSVRAAEAAGIAVLIVDSWSLFWAGKGGLLQRVDEEGRKPGHHGGSYTAWAVVNPLEQEMYDALLFFSGHVILTMRTKNDYEMTGKTVTKIGVKTIQREGAEYEVDVIIDMVEGTGTITKSRYDGLHGKSLHHPGPEMAATILEQLGQGVDPLTVLVDRLAVPVEGLTLDEVADVQGEAARRRLLQAPLLHPVTGDPTDLIGYLKEQLGNVVTRLLADPALTFQGVAALHARGKAGGWLTVPRVTDAATGEVTTLGELIAERGKALKPAPAPVSAPAAEEGAGADPTNPPPTAGVDYASGREADGLGTLAEPVAGSHIPPEDGTDTDRGGGPDRELATAPQTRKIDVLLRTLKIEERDRRLTAAGLVIGRKITAMKDLTFGEAGEVIDLTQSYVNRGEPGPVQFRDFLNAQLKTRQGAAFGAPAA